MNRRLGLPIASILLAMSVAAPASATTSSFDHIVLIVLENHSYGQIVGSSAAPYINSLIAANALATNYYARTHPSLPNYLALTGGSTFGHTTDCSPTSCPVNARNIGDTIEAAHKTWKAYMESMPSACGTKDSGSYAARHDPFVYYNDIRTNSSRCSSHVVPYTQLRTDFGSNTTTPTFAWITPNICNDMHDCSVSTGDSWLKAQLPTIFNSPAYKAGRTLVMITFDEGTDTNHVMTLFVSPLARHGYRNGTYATHYSLLRTLDYYLGLPVLVAAPYGDGAASPMTWLIQ